MEDATFVMTFLVVFVGQSLQKALFFFSASWIMIYIYVHIYLNKSIFYYIYIYIYLCQKSSQDQWWATAFLLTIYLFQQLPAVCGHQSSIYPQWILGQGGLSLPITSKAAQGTFRGDLLELWPYRGGWIYVPETGWKDTPKAQKGCLFFKVRCNTECLICLILTPSMFLDNTLPETN